jgi:hypothetical protein
MCNNYCFSTAAMDARAPQFFVIRIAAFLFKTILIVTNFDIDMPCAYVDIGQGAGWEYKE